MLLGLKLWSTNRQYVEPARDLFAQKVYDYIELFVVPESEKHCQMWEDLNIPFLLHAPHEMAGCNLACADAAEKNRDLIAHVAFYHARLTPEYTIFHPGMDGDIGETIRQLNDLRTEYPRIFESALIENIPRVGLGGEHGVGASPEEIRRIIDETNVGLCLDIGHALCYAAADRREPLAVLDEFYQLTPQVLHISDGTLGATSDSHLHLGEGSYPLAEILARVSCTPKMISIETAKSDPEKLDDFISDARTLREWLHA